MFRGENLVEYPGYGLLLKSFKIGTVNRILKDKTKNIKIKKVRNIFLFLIYFLRNLTSRKRVQFMRQ